MTFPLTPLALSEVEVRAKGVALGTGPSTSLRTNGGWW
ncbi:hypothetical protein BH10PSE15_BH10PSE15_14430 [soil metagenome]